MPNSQQNQNQQAKNPANKSQNAGNQDPRREQDLPRANQKKAH